MIDFNKLMDLIGIECCDVLKESHKRWMEESLGNEYSVRESKWSESIAVGSESFVEKTRKNWELEQKVGRSEK